MALMHAHCALRGGLEVLSHALTVDVLELRPVLLVETYLSIKQHVTEVDDLWNVRHLETLLKCPHPDAIHFANLSDFGAVSLSSEFISVQIKLKLKLEAEEYHAGSQDAWLILEKASIQHH